MLWDDIEADIILGNKDKSKIVEILNDFIRDRESKKIIYDLSSVEFEKMEISHFDNHTRAFVKIQDGCNAFCSYCIIPYTRGRVRSKNKEDVIEEVSRLVKEKCDFVASIPMKGDIDSLNASVATGVLAYEIVRQRLG